MVLGDEHDISSATRILRDGVRLVNISLSVELLRGMVAAQKLVSHPKGVV